MIPAHAQWKMFTRRERQASARSLVCLLQALSGRRTKLELRNELCITGTIHCVDCHMKSARNMPDIPTTFILQMSFFIVFFSVTLKDAETEKLNVSSISTEFVNHNFQHTHIHDAGRE